MTSLIRRSEHQPTRHQEDLDSWSTRRRIETTTKKDLERHIKRQVVLSDGRVIEEDLPEVITDTVEDTQTHEDSGDEQLRRDNFWNHDDTDEKTLAILKGEKVPGEIREERHRRQTRTNDKQSKSVSTAAGQHLGSLTSEAVDEVVRQGRGTRRLAQPYDVDDPRALVLPAEVVHQDRQHRRRVDQEDVREVKREHKGKLRTDRVVTREVVSDDFEETPNEDSSSFTESDSYDAGGHRDIEHKEESFVDYYKVNKDKKPEHVRRGLHMRSHDKRSAPLTGSPSNSRRPLALNHSDSMRRSSQQRHRSPLLLDDPNTRRMSQERRGSSERHSAHSASLSDHRRDQRRDQNRRMDDRFHTIERSNNLRRRAPMHRAGSSDRSHDGNNDHRRARSYSRTSDARKASTPTPRRHEALERAERLRRATSFMDRSNRDSVVVRKKENVRKTSILDGVKALLGRKNSKNKGKEPQAPPRKHRSIPQLDQDQDLVVEERSTNTAPRKWRAFAGLSIPGSNNNGNNNGNTNGNTNGNNNGNTNGYTNGHSTGRFSTRSRPWVSRSDGHDRPSALRRDTSFRNNDTSFRNESGNGNNLGLVRKKSFRADETLLRQNRDPPRFEADSPRSGRFFGQISDNETVEDPRERPPPDMRRLLLTNVNNTRQQSIQSKAADSNGRAAHLVRAL